MVLYGLIYHYVECSLHHHDVRLRVHDRKRLALCVRIQAMQSDIPKTVNAVETST